MTWRPSFRRRHDGLLPPVVHGLLHDLGGERRARDRPARPRPGCGSGSRPRRARAAVASMPRCSLAASVLAWASVSRSWHQSKTSASCRRSVACPAPRRRPAGRWRRLRSPGSRARRRNPARAWALCRPSAAGTAASAATGARARGAAAAAAAGAGKIRGPLRIDLVILIRRGAVPLCAQPLVAAQRGDRIPATNDPFLPIVS